MLPVIIINHNRAELLSVNLIKRFACIIYDCLYYVFCCFDICFTDYYNLL